MLMEARRRQNIVKQERRWLELTEGRKGSGASASVVAPTRPKATLTVTSVSSSIITSTGEDMTMKMTMVLATVSSTVSGEPPIDLEAALLSQGDEDDNAYSNKYKTTSEDRTDRGAVRGKQREEHEKQEKEKKAMEYTEEQLQQQIEEKQKQMLERALLAEEEKAVEERCKQTEERQGRRLE